MRVLFVASEAAPYAASGGLGDVMGALPGALKATNADTEISVILPLYGSMKEEYRQQMVKVCDLSFSLSWRKTGASVFRIEKDGVTYYFVENHYYFVRRSFYGEYDDGERFAFFCKAVMEFLLRTDPKPDILHANDWQSALAVIYLKTIYAQCSELSRIRTVYTIHNIEYQGKYDPYILGDVFDLDSRNYPIVEYCGCINLMKGALAVSDYVSTVSPHYALELRDDYFAFGLADRICHISGKMCGIINGIDYRAFSPEGGEDIYRAYSEKDLAVGKAANKCALQAELGLAQDPDTPLIAMVTRLTAGKGVDLVLRVLDEMLDDNIQFVILGTGDGRYESAFSAVAARRENMRALIKFDRGLSKKLYAAADIFLMPSKSEPCGLAQMIACSYGTVPIVRAVGGLYDSIRPFGTEGANGFRFDTYNAHDLLYTVRYALEQYRNPDVWNALTLSAKQSDFSWTRSAEEYLKIYAEILNWNR